MFELSTSFATHGNTVLKEYFHKMLARYITFPYTSSNSMLLLKDEECRNEVFWVNFKYLKLFFIETLKTSKQNFECMGYVGFVVGAMYSFASGEEILGSIKNC